LRIQSEVLRSGDFGEMSPASHAQKPQHPNWVDF
jgi:hypothetical protein